MQFADLVFIPLCIYIAYTYIASNCTSTCRTAAAMYTYNNSASTYNTYYNIAKYI